MEIGRGIDLVAPVQKHVLDDNKNIGVVFSQQDPRHQPRPPFIAPFGHKRSLLADSGRECQKSRATKRNKTAFCYSRMLSDWPKITTYTNARETRVWRGPRRLRCLSASVLYCVLFQD